MAGRYKAYPEYDSCESFPPASKPTHWVGMQVRHALRSASSSGSAIKGTVSSEPADHLFPAYSASGQDVWTVDWIYNEPGIVLSAVGARCGKTFRADGKWSVVANTGVFLLRSKMDRDFFWYVTNNEIFWEKGGSAQPYVQVPSTLAKRIGVPSLPEQKQIAHFLDHETGKIDALIEKQQALIALLQEKRQAVISHAVTKGLNPEARMKDFGVEWLGDVPEGWEVSRLGLLFGESSQRASTALELEFPILSVSIHHGISDSELSEGELDRKVTRSDDRSLYKVVHENDLAYNMMRAWQGGFGASKLSGLISPAYVVCKPKTFLSSEYFELVLRSPNAVTELKRYSRGITDFRLRLYWEEFKCIEVPIPPKDEIVGILKAIKRIGGQYDELGSVANEQILLLQERRTALISAAVTGKIDVRSWTAPEEPVQKEEV